jgi:integrase
MSVKIKLYTSKVNADGSHPVVVQVIHKGAGIIKKNILSVPASAWDSKNARVKASHPLSIPYNERISTVARQTEKRYFEVIGAGLQVTHDSIFGDVAAGDIRLTDMVQLYIDDLRNRGKLASANKHSGLILKIDEYDGKCTVQGANDIWLDGYYQFYSGTNKHNTIAKNIGQILTVLKFARKIGYKVNDRVFLARRNEKPTTKEKLTRDELQRWIELPLGTDPIGRARDAWLLCFMLQGRRIGDILTMKWDDIEDGALTGTTRKVEKSMKIDLLPEVWEIIEKYRGMSKYVLPIIRGENARQIDAGISMVNKYLPTICAMAGINKHITTHCARHTFAYLADIHGMSTKRIQDFLNHSKLSTTQGYLEDLRKADLLNKEMKEFWGRIKKATG